METIKLIPMTQWVIENYPANPQGHQSYLFGQRCISYAKFLSKPLTLSMFVPTTEAGGVLEEPEMYMDLQNVGSMNSHATEQDCIDAENYHRAKSRCLFEGFSLRKQYYLGAHILEVIYNNYPVLHYNSATKKFYDLSTEEYLIDRVELLIEYAGQATLTPTAKELICGNSR